MINVKEDCEKWFFLFKDGFVMGGSIDYYLVGENLYVELIV